MDGQTESLWLLQRSVLRAMQTRCKNHLLLLLTVSAHDDDDDDEILSQTDPV